MLYSYNWLKEFVPEIPSPEILMEQLTVRSVELEEVIEAYPFLKQVVLAEVIKCDPHPDADRLKVCTVFTGDEEFPVVCGGSNIRVGMRVAFAPVGAKVLWHGEGEPVVLEEARIRGQKSLGMICAAEEIGLAGLYPATDEREILDLSTLQASLGTPLSEALDLQDVLLDIDNKSMTHRADLFSHYGMAKEIAAVFHVEALEPTLRRVRTRSEGIALSVENAEDCPLYTAVALTVDNTQPTPEFIRKRLTSCGVALRNIVVDITNYVMLEYGQPLHAFDATQIEGGIMVRRARHGETLELLNGATEELTPENLIIADNSKPLAVAGVIGGMQSAVQPETQEIVLEIANFHPITVRQSARQINVRTESVIRYEKGLTTLLVELGKTRAVQLLQEYAGASVIGATQAGQEQEASEQVELLLSHLNRVSGVEFSAKQARSILERLGCRVRVIPAIGDMRIVVTPPWLRSDLNIPEDIIEEVVRLYGVENVPKEPIIARLTPPINDTEFELGLHIKELLPRYGLNEVMTYSFYGSELMQKMGYSEQDDEHVEIQNPLSEDLRYLRVSLLPRMLEAVQHNQRSMQHNVMQLFEVGHIYTRTQEARQLGIVVQSDEEGEGAVRRVRGIVEQLLQDLNIQYTTEIIEATAECPFWNAYHAKQALRYDATSKNPDFQDGMHEPIVGTVGRLSGHATEALGLHGTVGFALLSIPALESHRSYSHLITPPSSYPPVEIDLSLLMDESVRWHQIESVIRDHTSELLQSLSVVDVYRGEKLPEGKKSITCRMVLQSREQTLEMKVVELMRENTVRTLGKLYGVELRAN